MKFCPRCFARMSARWAKRCNYDPKATLDAKKMIFPCQVPIYEPDNVGETKVRIWDCVNNISKTYSLVEWNKMNSK